MNNQRQHVRGFTLIELMIVVAIVAILAAIAIGQYSNYIVRAQVTEASSLITAAKVGVAEYYNFNGIFPAVGSDIGLQDDGTDVKGEYVASVVVAGPVITATFKTAAATAGVKGANKNIAGQTITFTATDNVGSLSWACEATVIEQKYCPSSCKCK